MISTRDAARSWTAGVNSFTAMTTAQFKDHYRYSASTSATLAAEPADVSSTFSPAALLARELLVKRAAGAEVPKSAAAGEKGTGSGEVSMDVGDHKMWRASEMKANMA